MDGRENDVIFAVCSSFPSSATFNERNVLIPLYSRAEYDI